MVTQLQLGDIAVDVVLKDIKNVHLSVYPPTGRVRISAPSRMRLDTIRVFAISKLGWIKQQQEKLRGQERETPREYLDRESHYVWGKRYLLKVIEADESPSVELKHSRMILRLRPGTTDNEEAGHHRRMVSRADQKGRAGADRQVGADDGREGEAVLRAANEDEMGKLQLPHGSIRLNTELAKKPPECLEYIVVHEMAHLLVRHHNDGFGSVMDKCLPNWKLLRQALNDAPLAHTDWTY